MKGFREWLEESLLDEEEVWRTIGKNKRKIAIDTKSGKITKGMFAGTNIKNIKNSFNELKSKSNSKKEVKQIIKKSKDKAKKLGDALDKIDRDSRGIGQGYVDRARKILSGAKSIHFNAEMAEKKLKGAFASDPDLKKAFDNLNQARFKSADQDIEDIENYVNDVNKSGSNFYKSKVSDDDRKKVKDERIKAGKKFKEAMRNYIRKNPNKEVNVFGYWSTRSDQL